MTVQKIKLGALKVDSTIVRPATKPWGVEGTHAPSSGNIMKYTGGAINIVDTDNDQDMISWVPVKDENDKTLLIADRNLLTNISWEQLHEQGLISGREIELNGKRYKLRVLTGGDRPKNDDHEQGGFPNDNEWDMYITNRTNIFGLPFPNDADLDEYVSEESFEGEHNQVWNWAYTYSWCQDVYHHHGAYRAVRGYGSARYWNSSNATGRGAGVGWRPALEVLSSDDLTPGRDLNSMIDEELQWLIRDAETVLRERWVNRRVAELIDKGMEDMAERLKESMLKG